MGQLGSETKSDIVEIRPAGAMGQCTCVCVGGVEPLEGSIAPPVTHFSLKENPTGSKQLGGSQAPSSRGTTVLPLRRATSAFFQGLSAARLPQGRHFELFFYPGPSWACLLLPRVCGFSRALRLVALSRR